MDYVRWTPKLAATESELAAQVESFRSLDLDAAREAEQWLKERSLSQHPGIATWLVMSDRLEGFVALRMSEIELHQQQREELGKDRARQGAVLITWLARDRDSEIGLRDFLALVVLLAKRVIREVGAVAIAADPFDDDTAKLWRSIGFRSTRTEVGPDAEQKKRLWWPIPDLRSGD